MKAGEAGPQLLCGNRSLDQFSPSSAIIRVRDGSILPGTCSIQSSDSSSNCRLLTFKLWHKLNILMKTGATAAFSRLFTVGMIRFIKEQAGEKLISITTADNYGNVCKSLQTPSDLHRTHETHTAHINHLAPSGML